MDDRYLQNALVFKSFCDANRLMIIDLLRDGEKCACKLLEALQISQPTLSHHMKILCDAGIVNGRKAGKWMNYTLSSQGCERAAQVLIQILQPAVTTQDHPCEP